MTLPTHVYDVLDAAEYLGCTRDWVHKLSRRHHLGTMRNGRVKFTEDELEQMKTIILTKGRNRSED